MTKTKRKRPTYPIAEMLMPTIDQYIKDHNSTYCRLAIDMGLWKQFFGDMAKGKKMDLNVDDAIKICNFLDCTLDDLFNPKEIQKIKTEKHLDY